MLSIHDLLSQIISFFSWQKGEPLLFGTGTFWLIFIFFIGLYSIIHHRRMQMMLYVTAFSLFFYYKANGIFALLLIGTALVDWIVAQRIQKSTSIISKRIYLICSLILSIGTLAYFKYSNFFIDSWNNLLSENFPLLDMILPIGISFYTFQTVSYIVDVYKGKISCTRSFLQYLFYLSFFPLILAGPIMRADKFFPQIQDKKQISKSMIYGGLWLIIIGIVKKAIIADYIAQYNNWVFDDPLHYSGFEGVMAIIGYGAQIYCDFSGYSDMSIGIASIMGFDLGKNFDLPYQSSNLSEFWRRWHISLSTWMRDYIYIPLGGNRHGKFRTYLNNMVTMLAAGLWHGASWMFVVWGGMHGAGLIIHKLNKPWLDKLPSNYIIRFLSWLLTFTFVTFLWIFFRAKTMKDGLSMISHIQKDFDINYLVPFFHARTTWCIFLILIFLLHGIKSHHYDKIKDYFIKSPWIIKLIVFTIIIQLVIQFQSDSVQPFIYFQF